MGLIYVNPEGHLADGDPEQSARDIREVFARWVVSGQGDGEGGTPGQDGDG